MAPTWSSKRFALLGLVLLAQSSTCQGLRSAESFGFAALTSETPTPTPTKSTKTPKLTRAPETTPEPASATPTPKTTVKKTPTPLTSTPTVKTPKTSTSKPEVTISPVIGSASSSASSSSDSSAGILAPTPSPTPKKPAPTTAAPVPQNPYECSASNAALITNLYEKNNVLQGDCAAVNDYYRFPFEGAPTRAQMVNMSRTSACTVLMQALLQILAVECDFKDVAMRSTAEAVIQLSKEIKKGVEDLPSETTIAKAIQARRSDLLDIPESKDVAASSTETAVDSTMSDDTASKSSSDSDWAITDDPADEAENAEHILMSKDLLIVGTWSDVAEESNNGGTPAGSHHGSKAATVAVDAASSGAGSLHVIQCANAFAAVLFATWMALRE